MIIPGRTEATESKLSRLDCINNTDSGLHVCAGGLAGCGEAGRGCEGGCSDKFTCVCHDRPRFITERERDEYQMEHGEAGQGVPQGIGCVVKSGTSPGLRRRIALEFLF